MAAEETATITMQMERRSDLNAYCFTCGYKLRKLHCSVTYQRAKYTPGHKKDATRANPMGGSLKYAGWGNKPNGLEQK